MNNLSNKKLLLIVAITAMSLRLIYILWGYSDLHVRQNDTLSVIYISHGYGICAGYGYSTHLDGQGILYEKLVELAKTTEITPENAPKIDHTMFVPEMLHPPGMALLSALIHKITGTKVDIFLEFLGAVLDTIAACLVCYMISTFYHAQVGFITGMIYALYPPLAYASTVGRSPDGLLSVFVIGTLLCVLMSTRHKGMRTYLWCAFAGVLLAGGSYLRPDYLLMPVFVGVAYWIYTRKFWKSFFALIIVQTVALALLMPWAYHNHQLCGRWIITSTSVGATLITGLGENHNAWGFGGLDGDRGREAREQGFISPWCSEADLYFRKVYWDAITSKPLGFVMAILKRLPMGIVSPQLTGFDNPYKTSTFSQAMDQGKDRYQTIVNDPLYFIRAHWEMLVIGLFNVTCFLSSLYMVFRDRKRIGIMLLLLSPYLYGFSTHILTHMEPRFLLPCMFSLFMGFAYVIVDIRDKLQQQEKGPHNGL